MEKIIARQVSAAIKALDTLGPLNAPGNISVMDNERISIARRNLVNVLFHTGYELQEYTYRVIKSKRPRQLV